MTAGHRATPAGSLLSDAELGAVEVVLNDVRYVRTTQDLSNHRADRLIGVENAAKMLAGDLRRLEQDIVDEGAICRDIACRSGLDEEIVAAVLKEFVSV